MKRPSFQFYPADFLADERVALMSNQELGCYIKLICYCWREGSIPSDVSKIARLCGEDSSAMAQLWQNLCECFEAAISNKDRLVHPRLEKERQKQEEHRKERSEAGKAGAKSRWEKAKGNNNNDLSDDCSAITQPCDSHSSAISLPMAKDSFSSSTSISSSSNTPVVPIAGDARIPFEEIRELFHQILPELPKVKLFDDKRKRAIRVRWRADARFQSLEFWKRFFSQVRHCDLLMGRVQGKDGRTWNADFDWLLSDKGFKGVIEGKYESRATA